MLSVAIVKSNIRQEFLNATFLCTVLVLYDQIQRSVLQGMFKYHNTVYILFKLNEYVPECKKSVHGRLCAQ